MKKYFKKTSKHEESSRDETRDCDSGQQSSKKARRKFDPNNFITNPGLRPNFSEYESNDHELVRRTYLQKGPCQPRTHDFPFRQFGKDIRRFVPTWFDEHKNWLEYSVAMDQAFCLCCYLFKTNNGDQGGGNVFVIEGFSNWKEKKRLQVHVGCHNSSHNDAVKKCEALMKQKQLINVAIIKSLNESKVKYRARLDASIACIRFLLHQGLAFRGHNESEEPTNKGNFLELLEFLASRDESIKNFVLKNAPENNKLTSPIIQKEIVNAAAAETIEAIIRDIRNELFSILVDESRDVSVKEQMAVILRYVDKRGQVIERFLTIVHVQDTSSLQLKAAIDSLFSKYNLSISNLRGQGYDGASNMRGEFNRLKSLILKENLIAHQLQLTLVAVAQNHSHVALLFNLVGKITNIVGGSCKRRDTLREKEVQRVSMELECGQLSSGRGLNQETNIKRAGDARWGSHYGALLSLIHMFSSVIDVLEIVTKDGSTSEQRGDALALLNSIQTFEFAFLLRLMKIIFGRTNELSQALQRKDQDIINAMALVRLSKQQLDDLRNNEWESFMNEVSLFCSKQNIEIPFMEDKFIAQGRSRCRAEKTTNMHHFRIGIFNTMINWQLNELNDRFNETNTELLLCVACLDPSNGFAAFDKQKLIRLAELYPSDFSSVELKILGSQLDTYILDMCSNDKLSQVTGISDLSKILVELKKSIVYPLVYLLIKLALLLPIATATVERTFSAMNIVKNRLRNRMGDE